MKYRCYIVDDEPLAVKVIENYLAKLESFTVIGTATDPTKAYSALHDLDVDLLFLDIEMPGLKGLDLLRALRQRPEVIVTTAYREYAVEGFELELLDYLVKPIPFPRFLQSINRFLEKRNQVSTSADSAGHLFVRADRKSVKVDFDDVLYIQGVKDYVKIVTSSGQIVTKLSIGQISEQLPPELFARVHKSYIVAKDKVTAVTNHDVEIGEIEIPIGRTYREEVKIVFS